MHLEFNLKTIRVITMMKLLNLLQLLLSLSFINSVRTVTEFVQLNGQLKLTDGYIGNDIKLRQGVPGEANAMTWVDVNNMLPSGKLSQILLHTFRRVNLPPSLIPIRLQIWRPTSIALMKYILVWEYRYLMSSNYTIERGSLIQLVLDSSEQFQVQWGDRLGWTCELSLCPLTFDELDGTLITVDSSLPILNTESQFQVDPNGLYGVFSCAVLVIPDTGDAGPVGPRGATGFTGPAGRIGATGLQGEPGESVAGPPGSRGLRGATGLQGPAGLQGEPGPMGLPGMDGMNGSQGLPGATGPQGLQGLQGKQGPPGEQGPPGPNSVSDVEVENLGSRLTGAIVGIVVPFSILIVFLVLAVIWLICRNRNKGDQPQKYNNNTFTAAGPLSYFSNDAYDSNPYEKKTDLKENKHNSFRSINNLKPMEYIANDENVDV